MVIVGGLLAAQSAGAGEVSFGPQQVITTQADGARWVYAADLDRDGDLDVLSASDNDSKIAWHKNPGEGAFGSQEVLSEVGEGPLAAKGL